jgi:hypothetical protein
MPSPSASEGAGGQPCIIASFEGSPRKVGHMSLLSGMVSSSPSGGGIGISGVRAKLKKAR